MVNNGMTVTYLPESTQNNPRAASFSLGMKILHESMRCLTVIRTDNDWERMRAKQKPSNPMLAGFPLAQYLFLTTTFSPQGSDKVVPLALSIDLTDAGADNDHLSIMLDVRNAKQWSDEGIKDIKQKITAFLNAAQYQEIHTDYLLKHAPTQAGLDLNDPWKKYVFNIWEHAKSDYVASHGGDMELLDVTFKQNEEGGTDISLVIRPSGSCGGCPSTLMTISRKILPGLLEQIEKANESNSGGEGYPLKLNRNNIHFIQPTEAIFLKAPALKAP